MATDTRQPHTLAVRRQARYRAGAASLRAACDAEAHLPRTQRRYYLGRTARALLERLDTPDALLRLAAETRSTSEVDDLHACLCLLQPRWGLDQAQTRELCDALDARRRALRAPLAKPLPSAWH